MLRFVVLSIEHTYLISHVFKRVSMRICVVVCMFARAQKRNNEMVIDLSSVAPRLPSAIEGFFYVKDAADYKINEARDAYARFKEFYSMADIDAPPLMEVDMAKAAPFALDASLAPLADTISYAVPYGHSSTTSKKGHKKAGPE